MDTNSGIETLRRGLAIRYRQPGTFLHSVVRDTEGLSLVDLDAFATNKLATLPPRIVERVAQEFYGDRKITYDETIDRFHQAEPPVLSLGPGPASLDPKNPPAHLKHLIWDESKTYRGSYYKPAKDPEAGRGEARGLCLKPKPEV